METEAVILLRFVERLLAVSIGGFAVYLGYRLFSQVPISKDSKGRITLAKDVSIVISRVGPGVFFALFGAAVVGLSLHEGVALKIGSDDEPSLAYYGAGASPSQTTDDVKHDQRMRLRREIAFLNTLPRLLAPDLPSQDRSEVERAIPRIKFALMKPLWGKPADGWGTPEEFERWRREGDHKAPPEDLAEAISYFNYPSSGSQP